MKEYTKRIDTGGGSGYPLVIEGEGDYPGRIEHSSGIPSPVGSDLTPIEDPHPPRRARARTTTGPQRPASES